jgi:hypothetical protein
MVDLAQAITVVVPWLIFAGSILVRMSMTSLEAIRQQFVFVHSFIHSTFLLTGFCLSLLIRWSLFLMEL